MCHFFQVRALLRYIHTKQVDFYYKTLGETTFNYNMVL